MFKTGYLETGMIIHSSKALESSEAVSHHSRAGEGANEEANEA